MRKILFLDIDGTLMPITEPISSVIIPKHIVEAWNKYISYIPDCEIVYETHSCSNILELEEFTKLNNLAGRFIGKTNKVKLKGDDIEEWLVSHNFDKSCDRYCILDDLDSFAFKPKQRPYFIKVDFAKGITEQDLQEVVKLLNKN